MAEIKIEKKKSPIWPWILIALFFIAILIYLFFPREERFERGEMSMVSSEESMLSSDTLEVSRNSTAILAYVNFINDDPDKMDLDQEFTNEALLRLTNATKATADEIGYEINKELGEVKAYTDKVTVDPFQTTPANSIRSAAVILAAVLQNIQQASFSGLETEAVAVKDAAEEIKADVLTLDQREAVKNYFMKSANLLEKMNPNSTDEL
jgi:hypothetical protein